MINTLYSSSRTLIYLLILCVVTTAILLFASIPGSTLVLSALQNTGHTILFGVLTYVVLTLTRKNRKSPVASRIVLISSFLFLFGLSIEFAQTLVNRNSSWDDVILNSEGIVIGVLVHCARQSSRWVRTANYSIAVIILLHSFKLPITYGIATHFLPDKPVIADFEGLGALVKVLEAEGVTLKLKSSLPTWKTNDSKILQVEFESGDYPGFRILEPFRSWYKYEYFAFSVFNPASTATSITIRIHDEHHNEETQDRFNRSVTLDPGETKITIPMDNIRYLGDHYSDHRQMDLRNVVGIIVFMEAPESSISLFFDDFRLE